MPAAYAENATEPLNSPRASREAPVPQVEYSAATDPAIQARARSLAKAKGARMAYGNESLIHPLPEESEGSEMEHDQLPGGDLKNTTQPERISATENALAATTVINELTDRFPEIVSNEVIKTGLPWAALLLLKPERQGSGVMAAATDPRVWSLAAVSAVAIARRVVQRPQAKDFVITRYPSELAVGSTFRCLTNAPEGSAITWEPSDDALATVDTNGVVTAKAKGTLSISARMGNSVDILPVTIK
jgi:Bacterial Ig-like domain (group 2)